MNEPRPGYTIWFTWGEEIVKATVLQTSPYSIVAIEDTTDPTIFGGSASAYNIDFKKQDWIYDR